MSELSKKLARTVGLFYKIRHYTPRDTLVLLYHAIFASFLTYGVSTWGLTYPSLLEPIAILQKKMRSITFNENTAPSTPIFDTLQILKFNDVILLQITSFVYECVTDLAPIYFRDFFRSIQNVHDIGTRQSERVDLFALRCNTTQYGLRSVHYSGVRLWNSLPQESEAQIHFQILRKKLKAICYHFIDHN